MNCRGQNAFGRRRKRQVFDDTDSSLSSQLSAFEGLTREEVTVQSNPILALERREDRLLNPTEGKCFRYSLKLNYHAMFSKLGKTFLTLKTHFSSSNPERRSLCVNGGIHHLSNHHRATRPRRSSRSSFVLAAGVQKKT